MNTAASRGDMMPDMRGAVGQDDLDAAVAGALVGARTPSSTDDARKWLARAEPHGVHLLLADRWLASSDATLRALRPELLDRIRGAAVVDAVRADECRRVCTALSAAGVRAAVLKGEALAHGVYRESYLRPRTDTDILIDRDSRAAVSVVLIDQGYSADVETSGSLVSSQSHFSRLDRSGLRHAWDVHWRVSNVHAVADVVTLDRIAASGTRPAPLAGVFAPAAADALLLACVHRIAHHHDAPDLIWLYDIHLIAEAMSPFVATAFVRSARELGVWTMCARSLARARERLGTTLPAAIDAALAETPPEVVEASEAGWREVDVLRGNLRALSTWPDRARLLREHLFPPPAFIASKYRLRSRAALPWAYLHRIVTGAPKWFRRHGAV
jgi:hypothetical protein